MPSLIFFITCVGFCGQWAVDPSPTNLIHSKAIFLFRSWINGPDGAKKLIGSYPFVEIENRPAPLSFVKLSLSAQIYYFCDTNLGAVNHSAKLRFVELHRFRKELHECVSLVDKWCYSLKHVGSLDRLPEELRVRVFERLFEACEIAKFTPEEKLRYEHDMITERDYDNIIYTAKVEGRTEGKAEGKTDVARAMKAKGLETSLISELTWLSEEEIQRL